MASFMIDRRSRRNAAPFKVRWTRTLRRSIGSTLRRARSSSPRRSRARAAFAASVNAGTVDDHIGRFRQLAEAGVSEVVLRLVDGDSLEPMKAVIDAFR